MAQTPDMATDAADTVPLIAAVLHADGIALDRLISAAADRLAAEGVRLCGAVQANMPVTGLCSCDMELRDLASGTVLMISQDLGPEARGCRLDTAALEQMAGLVEAALAKGPDLLILNKFGKREAAGGGFRDVLAKAALAGIPTLIGIGQNNLADWSRFSGGAECRLPADIDALLDWARRVCPTPQHRAKVGTTAEIKQCKAAI